MPNASSEVIENWVKIYRKSTQKAYRIHVQNFFKAIDKDPDTYFDGGPEVKHDLVEFLTHMRDKEERPGGSIRTTLHAVKSFLEYYEHEPSRKTWRWLMRLIQGTRAATKTEVPKPHELKEILEHGDLKARSFYLILSSSGMRIGEALQLRRDDIDLNNEPTKIMLRGEYTKTGNQRITFISDEATEALKIWLRQRDNYLTRAVKKTNFKCQKESDDPRIFPFSANMIRQSWNKMLEKAGYDDRDPTTNRRKMTPHSLRKYFRTYMSTELDEEIVETLIGHEKYLRRVYLRHDDSYLADQYQKAEEKIVVFQKPLDKEEINKQIKDVKLENLELRQDVKRLMKMYESQLTDTRPDGTTYMPEHWAIDEENNTAQRLEFNKEKRGWEKAGPEISLEEYEQRQREKRPYT